MSSTIDQIKQTANDAVQTVKGGGDPTTAQAKEDTSSAGSYPKPDDYSAKSQRDQGRTVGIEADMPTKPIVTKQEGEDEFVNYKAAGKLQGKKALVTGGDSGIGRAAAIMYAMEGADVAINYLPEEQVDAEAVKACITKLGRRCLLIPQDIRSKDGCEDIVKKVVAEFGQIDILVNNASVMYDCPKIQDIDDEQFHRTIDTNLKGTFFLTRAAVPHIPKGGAIIITASQVAYAGPPSLVDYSMTKGAQVSFMRCLSNQLLGEGIRVNCVCPGPVWTPLQEAAMDKSTLSNWLQTPAPIGRHGQPAELGPAYVFLASADGSFISGQSIHVNGGAIVSS